MSWSRAAAMALGAALALSLTLPLSPAAATENAPAITSITPAHGPVQGGNEITIDGTDLAGSSTTSVTVGGQPAVDVAVAPDGTSLTAVVPAGQAGPNDVVVTTSGGSDTLSGGYFYASYYVLDNQAIRFGDGSQNSVTPAGTLAQPWYYSADAAQYFKLTFASYPLDYAVGSGVDGGNWSGAYVTDNPTISNQVIDYSGFVPAADISQVALRGYGTIVSTGVMTLNGQQIEVRNTFELGETALFVKVTTRLTNLDEGAVTNLHLWAGTRDDWVGSSDGPTKTKGTLQQGAFTPTTNEADPGPALMITSADEGVLFYSTTPNTNSSIDNCCQFSRAYNVDPVTSPLTRTGDGSYALHLPAGDLAPTASTELTWFYAAGSLAQLAEVTSQVAAAAAPRPVPQNQSVYLEWTAPQSDVPITNYAIRYSSDGGQTWTDVPLRDPSAVTHDTITGLENGVTYEFQVAAITGTDPDTTQGPWSSSSNVTIPGVPTAPELISATPHDGWATIAFTPGTTPFTLANHEYQLNGGAWTAFDPPVLAGPVAIHGLTDGVTYSVRFRSVNEFGPSAASAALSVTPAGIPGQVGQVWVDAGDSLVDVSWDQPENNGGAITDYIVEYSDNDGDTWTTVDEGESTLTYLTVDGLTNGTTYVFRVAAVNAVGTGAVSPTSPPARPLGPVGVPTGITLVAGDGHVDVTWSATSGGGLPPTYNVEWSTSLEGPWTEGPLSNITERAMTLTGLENGVPIYVRVQVETEQASGEWSPAAGPVTPHVVAVPPTRTPSVTYPDAVSLVVGRPIVVRPTLVNGDLVTGFALQAKRLPLGLVLNTRTGVISGTPLAQGGPWAIRVAILTTGAHVAASDVISFRATGGFLAYFAPGSATLSSQGKTVLRVAVLAIAAHPRATLTVRGYAAYIQGSEQAARLIAAKRALSVANYLRALGVGRSIRLTVAVGHTHDGSSVAASRRALVTLSA